MYFYAMRYSYAMQNQAPAVVFFTIFSLAYGAYIYIYTSATIRKRFYDRWGEERGSLYHVLISRGIFAVLGGVISVIVGKVFFAISPAKAGLTFSLPYWPLQKTLLWLVILSCIVGLMLWFSKKTERLLAAYPQIRLKQWNFRAILLNIVSWAAYLLAYEIMFRGYLLFPLLSAGIWVAIAINTSLYIAVHLPKGLSESIGAAVYGPIVCILTLESGTLWIAFVSHLVLALANSFSNLRAQPNMQVVSSGEPVADERLP